ncbi:MAG TPA: hypothetical protein VLF71_00245 [Candidatus Saccharimonadales bacterium]|nr:hypothetical protein [Candidatus Saccharimonadales bacterium]
MIPTRPITSLRYLSLYAMGAVLLAGLWVLVSAKQGAAVSISERLSNNRRQFIGMGLALTLLGLVFYSSVLGWLAPTYHLGVGFFVLLAAAYVAQLLVSWAPYVGKSTLHTQLHTRGGEFVALAMFGCLAMVFAGNYRTLPWASYWLCLVTMLFAVVAIALYIGSPRIHKHMAVYESVYVVLFAASVAALTLRV